MTFFSSTTHASQLQMLMEKTLTTLLAWIVVFGLQMAIAQPTHAQQESASDVATNEYQDQNTKPTSYDQEYGDGYFGYSNKTYDPAYDPRKEKPDSIRYYGPGRTWQYWEANGLFQQRTWLEGRDTWWFFTAGNERFYRSLSVKLGKLDVSVDFFRLLDTRNRDQRFQQLGLINEPNFEQATKADEYGFWMDQPMKTHPEYNKVKKNDRYPKATDWQSRDGIHPPDPYYPKNVRDYGYPTGVVGLRKYPNPRFTEEHKTQWQQDTEKSVREYFANPGKVEPPYLFGITCCLCHVAFDPTNPPDDPTKPRWENLSANIGNQYFREGDLFFGFGRITGGDASPTSDYDSDPYQTLGLGGCGVNKELKNFLPESHIRIMAGKDGDAYVTDGNYAANVPPKDVSSINSMTLNDAEKMLRDAPAGQSKQHLSNLLFHYAQSQQSGTSETSRFSYDFINNPNTINKIFFVAGRPRFVEESPAGERIETLHVLKDGADSVGIPAALSRVYVNIGAEAEYWLTRLWNPLAGTGPHPLSIAEMKLDDSVPEFRRRELQETIPNIGQDWKRIESRMPALANYLTSYNSPFLLKDAVARAVDKLDKNANDYKTKKQELIDLLPDESRLANGRRMFGLYCAECHSNRKPTYPLTENDHQEFFRQSVDADDFLVGNPLTNDVRYPVTVLGINSQRAFATNAIDGEIWAEFSSKDYKALPSVGTMQFSTPLHLLNPKKFGTEPIKTSFVAPGGGRGYYRTASLVSLWATAPYLHNNSVGQDPFRRFEYKTDNPFDASSTGFLPDVVTVQGRMKLFEDGIERLLGLRSRDNAKSIKLTYAQASLLTGLDRTKSRLIADAISQALAPMIEKVVEEQLNEKVEDEKFQAIVQAAIAEALGQAREELPDFLNELDKKELKSKIHQLREDVQQIIRPFLTAILETKIKSKLEKGLAKEFPNLPDSLTAGLVELIGKVDFAQLIESGNGVLGAGPVSLFFPEIPRRTPINLILNQNIRKAPYAVQALISHKDEPRQLVEALLKLSDCPDIVEDRGHHYPTPEQRALEGEGSMRDLIEYLKTL